MDNSEKPDSQSNSGFWSTLPGILTGISGVIAAITALILGLKEVGLIGQALIPVPTPTPTMINPTSIQPVPTPTPDSTEPIPTPTPDWTEPIPTPTPSTSTSGIPPSVIPAAKIPQSAWEFMGFALTGEAISVNINSVNKSDSSLDFEYKIGDELISASADCKNNRWYAKGYEWYSPQSEATQKMLNFVCGL